MTGFYSIVQFCPDLSRAEAMNVGVVLFCPDANFLQCKLTGSLTRVRKAFGSATGDADRVRAAIAALEGRLTAERKDITSAETLAQFGTRQANSVQLTAPRRVMVEDSRAELRRLFERLVTPQKPRPQTSARAVLDAEFAAPAYRSLIRYKPTVAVPDLGHALTLPYGYQKNRFNLIQPAKFSGETASDILQSAGRFALEGDLLYHTRDAEFGDLQLVVVGQFPKGERSVAKTVERLLARRNTILHQLEESKRLFDEIKAHAKPFRDAPDERSLFAETSDS